MFWTKQKESWNLYNVSINIITIMMIVFCIVSNVYSQSINGLMIDGKMSVWSGCVWCRSDMFFV